MVKQHLRKYLNAPLSVGQYYTGDKGKSHYGGSKYVSSKDKAKKIAKAFRKEGYKTEITRTTDKKSFFVSVHKKVQPRQPKTYFGLRIGRY